MYKDMLFICLFVVMIFMLVLSSNYASWFRDRLNFLSKRQKVFHLGALILLIVPNLVLPVICVVYLIHVL